MFVRAFILHSLQWCFYPVDAGIFAYYIVNQLLKQCHFAFLLCKYLESAAKFIRFAIIL